MAQDAASFPFEALADGVAHVEADGAFTPCNASMHALLAAWSPDAARRERLLAGDPLRVSADGRHYDLRCTGEWLVARAVHGGEQAEVARFAAARVRLLGDLAGSIAHDLANLLGSAMGLAAMLESNAGSDADRRLILELQQGATRGAAMTRALARMLKRSPRERVVVAVAELVAGACGLASRAAAARRTGLAVEVAPDLPSVCVVADEAQQALMLGIVALIDAAPGRVGVTAQQVRAAIAGGRERACVRVRVAADACTRPIGGEAAPAGWQLTAALLLAGVGGELTRASEGDRCVLDYVWPAAAADAVSARSRSAASIADRSERSRGASNGRPPKRTS